MRIFNRGRPESVHASNHHQLKTRKSDKKGVAHLGKKILFHVSLAYTMANQSFRKTYQWWNPIKGTRVILGGIPLKNKGHHTKIIKLVTASNKIAKLAVLTLLEPFEIYSKSPLATPVSPKDWENLHVKHKIIVARDFKPLSQKQIREAVRFLEKQDEKGVFTYVHCKAGRGRSATAVICFLMKKYGYTAETARAIVKESRIQINLNKYQWQAIKDYETGLVARRVGLAK